MIQWYVRLCKMLVSCKPSRVALHAIFLPYVIFAYGHSHTTRLYNISYTMDPYFVGFSPLGNMHRGSLISLVFLTTLVSRISMGNSYNYVAGYDNCSPSLQATSRRQPVYQCGHMWAACYSDSQLKAITKGRVSCSEKTGTHCWYTCWDDSRFFGDKSVTGIFSQFKDCMSCRTERLSYNNDAKLKKECFQPKAETCDWYRDCLEEIHPCMGSRESYAIDFGEKYCKRYDASYASFSPQGRIWIDKTRKCLQERLVPLLNNTKATCRKIQAWAFNTHTNCYVESGVCNLPLSDYWKIATTVGPAFRDAFFKTVGQTLSTAVLKCKLLIPRTTTSVMRWLSLTVKRVSDSFGRRSISLFSADDTNHRAMAIADALSQMFGWTTSSIDAIGYGKEGKLYYPSELSVVLILTDRHALYEGKNSSTILNEAVAKLKAEAQSGKVR